jgi:metal-responsive CopG/Arc/MetJ family transcriptional regulator
MKVQKISVSLRLEIIIVDKVDTIGIKEDRSRNWVVNRFLKEYLKNYEEKNGEIEVNFNQLKKFRRKRRSAKKGATPAR